MHRPIRPPTQIRPLRPHPLFSILFNILPRPHILRVPIPLLAPLLALVLVRPARARIINRPPLSLLRGGRLPAVFESHVPDLRALGRGGSGSGNQSFLVVGGGPRYDAAGGCLLAVEGGEGAGLVVGHRRGVGT